MKRNMLFFGVVLSVVAISCNSGDTASKTDTPVTMDSPMVNKDHTIAPVADSDKAKMVAIATPVKATPNPAKKGMKLKVMITLPLMGEGAMVADKEGYYINTEVLPSYPGGEKELQRFFEKNIEYPADAEDNGIEGTVKLNFAVDENGKIYSPIVTTPNIGYGVEQEALRVFSKMPAWTPGKIKGKNVKTRFTLPVTFKLF